MDKYLAPSYFFDFESPEINKLVGELTGEEHSLKQKIEGLYLKVRDGWRYNPYDITIQAGALRSSAIARKKHGHCIDKAILYISGLRALGIPARLHLAKVQNHIAVERLTEKFGTNELTPHGMVDVYYRGAWKKATPAFNKELCLLTGVAPLKFDGSADSIFQAYSTDGKIFMEYLEDYGSFDDVPLDFIEQNMKDNYPKLESLLDAKGKLTW